MITIGVHPQKQVSKKRRLVPETLPPPVIKNKNKNTSIKSATVSSSKIPAVAKPLSANTCTNVLSAKIPHMGKILVRRTSHNIYNGFLFIVMISDKGLVISSLHK